MKAFKYIGALFFLLLGLSEALSIYLISSGLLQAQEYDKAYFIGKLVGHIVGTVLVMILAFVLYKSAKKHECENQK